MAASIGARVREVRQRTGKGGQEVADHCTKVLGFKMLRTTLANLEAGTRKSVSVAELVALSDALEVSPLSLLYPLEKADSVEYLPDFEVTPWEAWDRFTAPLVSSSVPGPFPEPTSDKRTAAIVADLTFLEHNGAVWKSLRENADNPRNLASIRAKNQSEADKLIVDSASTLGELQDWGIPLDWLDPDWLFELTAFLDSGILRSES